MSLCAEFTANHGWFGFMSLFWKSVVPCNFLRVLHLRVGSDPESRNALIAATGHLGVDNFHRYSSAVPCSVVRTFCSFFLSFIAIPWT